MLLTPSPLSQTVTLSRTPSPFERDVLYGRPPIGILNSHGIIIWSSLLERFSGSATRSALNSPRLDLNDAIPMLSSLADFVRSQRDLLDECKKHGQF